MPEGPSILILREEAERFAGQVVRRVEGDAKVDLQRLQGRRLTAVRSWGKQLLLELDEVTVRVHLLLFGSYAIDARKDRPPRLGLGFDNGELNFYGCSVRLLDEPPELLYDWRSDTLSERWDPALALEKLRAMPDTQVCDVILDQEVFAGAGNIFKNEVLFRIRVHPLSTLGALPADKLQELVTQVRQYAFDFLAWKRAFVLKRHWQAHRQSRCPRCAIALSKAKLGRTQRQSYYCEQCQIRYG